VVKKRVEDISFSGKIYNLVLKRNNW